MPVALVRQAIGVLGSMFDPVHFGHLRIALEAYELLPLREVRMLPCGTPPHRTAPVASAQQRLTMLQLAIEGQRGLVVDEREIQRSGPSYMVDTLSSIRAEVGDTPLCLLLGMDAFVALPGWHQWRRLFDLAHLVVVCRPGWEIPEPVDESLYQELRQRLASEALQLLAAPAGSILLQEVTQLDIASSHIRALIQAGRSPRYLLPHKVAAFIETEQLYRTGG